MSINQGKAAIYATGASAAGQQSQGKVVQYYSDAINGVDEAADLSTGVHPYDSGTIVIQTSPGKSPEKLVNGVVQRASQIVCTGRMEDGITGNNAGCTLNTDGEVPTLPSGANQSDGLSSFPGRE